MLGNFKKEIGANCSLLCKIKPSSPFPHPSLNALHPFLPPNLTDSPLLTIFVHSIPDVASRFPQGCNAGFHALAARQEPSLLLQGENDFLANDGPRVASSITVIVIIILHQDFFFLNTLQRIIVVVAMGYEYKKEKGLQHSFYCFYLFPIYVVYYFLSFFFFKHGQQL